ncbi:MAG: hydantoinase/oxoprolinase family protein, partial [Candidatus Dadabacteria bacterium]|nr:hydantoinase/oxoprolinase family protein [Candidatus Dadabacteria bacterium]
MLSVGIDAGGTFTDFVFFDGKEISVNKVPSTPCDPCAAVLSGLKSHPAEFSSISEVLHGTTVATNALLQRDGAKTCLVTTKGFEDVIEIRRQNREKLYDLSWTPEPPLVPPHLRFGLSERTDYRGRVLIAPDEAEIEKIMEKMSSLGVQAVAVCFLHSYANPENEHRVGALLSGLGIPITLSSELVAEFREYERTSTTVLNSYLIPKVNGYARSLSLRLEGKSLSVMQSNGGVISAEQAAEEPAKIVLSGPAGGVVGAFEICSLLGRKKIITYDMGGTSTDISLCDGSISFTTQNTLGGVAIKLPMINISTIGAGGGSIAHVAEGGVLKVGPQSAGADPGPACYGKGTEPTVTDANIVLGRLDPGWFLGGGMDIYPERSFEALHSLAPDRRVEEIAESIIKIANSNMEKALRIVSIGGGHDPREFCLVSFGGSGGLHACELALSIGIRA